MSAAALSADDEARLGGLAAAILADAAPARALKAAVEMLAQEQRPALAAALYDAVCYRVDVQDYWLQHGVWRAYRALGPARDDATFAHAAAAVQMHPDYDGSPHMFRSMFQILCRRGRDREALELFDHQMRYSPALPSAAPWELAALRQRAGLAADATVRPRADAYRVHAVMSEERRAPWRCAMFGGGAYALAPLAEGMTRPAITVAEFADAELLIHHDTVAVLDRFGDLHDKWSVAEFPAQVRAWFAREAAAGASFPLTEVDEAVLVTDKFPLRANICHTVLDHLTHVPLYQRLGVDTGTALVIGPEPGLPAQQDILRRAGVTEYLGIGRVARVRARRLWVSSNCADLCHAAHYGAAWAVAFIRETLGGRGDRGWRRLYLSRGDVPTRRVTNEPEVVALLEAHGFEAIVPGRMAYHAQLAAFRQASHVIAPHGAALTHAVLCPPGAHVLEIFHPLYGTAAYAMQAEAAGFDYAAMVARDWESDAPEWNDPTVADIGDNRFLERHMRVDLDLLSRYLATVLP